MPRTDHVSPQWSRSALLLIDVQLDFVSGSSIVDGTADRVPMMARLAAAFRAAHRPVIHIVRLYVPGDSDVDAVRRSAVEDGALIVAPGTPGAQIPSAVLPHTLEIDGEALLASEIQPAGRGEFILFKPRWSAFYRTALDTHLATLGVSTVVVAGCNLPNCPRATLFDASERDYRTVLATDATSQTSPERLADLALIGVNLLDTETIIESLAAQCPSPPPTIRVVAAVIVDDHGRTLVVRKRGTTAFMQPGGKIDDGETSSDALRRELWEELGVTVRHSDVTALGAHVAKAANEPDHLVEADLFRVTLRDRPHAAAEIEEIRWIDPEAPGDIDLAPLTEETVFRLLREDDA
jgi:nicotinamidase-related amidase/8-oxo-dGTP pyrophosphatase MutT (NUDIX family)